MSSPRRGFPKATLRSWDPPDLYRHQQQRGLSLKSNHHQPSSHSRLTLRQPKRNLRIGIEGTDVRPGGRRVLLGIGHRGVVRIRGIARPGVGRHRRMIVTHRRRTARGCARGIHRQRSARHAGRRFRRRQLAGAAAGGAGRIGAACIIATGVAACDALNDDGKAWTRLTSAAMSSCRATGSLPTRRSWSPRDWRRCPAWRRRSSVRRGPPG